MAYWAKSVRFDGSNDYLTRGANLTGVSDGGQGIFSCWVRFRDGDANTQILLNQGPGGSGNFFVVRFPPSFGNILRIAGSTGVITVLDLKSQQAITTADGWVHILASWNVDVVGGGEAWLYIDDVASTDIDTATGPIDYTEGNFSIGAETDGGAPINADIADFFLDLSTHLDLSVTANRRKFIDASGNPVDLDSDGSLPLGFAPDIFLHGDVSTWHTNDGTGGGFTENGALVESQGPAGYGINADEGEYTVSGQAVDIEAARKLAAAAGSYTLTGQAVSLNFGLTIGADAGVYALTGQAAGLRHAHKLAAAAGAYVLDGQDVGLESARPAEGGLYTLTGQDIVFILSRRINRIRLTGTMVKTVYLTGRMVERVKLARQVA